MNRIVIRSASCLRNDLQLDRQCADEARVSPDRVELIVDGKPVVTYSASPVAAVVVRREGTALTYYHD